MSDFEEIIARLNQKTGEKARFAYEQTEELLELPSLGITKALGGGIPYGHQTLIWGNKSGTKSTLAYGAIANAQRAGKVCMLIDSEKAMRAEWLEALGVDTHKLVHRKAVSIDDIARLAMGGMQAGVGVIVIDSITVLLPGAYYEKDGKELKTGMDGSKQIGTLSKDLSNLLAKLNGVNKDTALILISQVRNQIGTTHTAMQPTGGLAVGFYNTVSIKLWSSTASDKQIKDKITSGDHIYEEVVGREVHWLIDKDRGPGMNRDGKYNFYFKGDVIGIDTEAEMIDEAEKYGLIKKAGAWYTIYGEQKQGKKEAAKYLRSAPEVREKLWQELLSV